MAVTIFELAKAAGVSISTVSRALNGNCAVSEETRARICELAAAMGYRPNERARSLARGKSGVLLFAANLSRGVSYKDSHLFEIISGIVGGLEVKNYSLEIKHLLKEDAPEKIRELMQSEQADGVILHAGILTKALASVLISEELPHLVIGKPDFECPVSWMDISHESTGQLAANYLLDKGYRHIVFFMGEKDTDVISERRLHGLLTVLNDEDIPIEVQYDIPDCEESRRRTAQILEREKLPEVILCTSNFLALGCVQSIQAKGLNIPRDIAVMTFDEYPFALLVQPQLTSIALDMYEMGWQAARFMTQKVNKPNLATQSFITTPYIHEGEST